MTVDEAMAVLELEAGAEKSEIRRAYLRKLKQHKPEADPAGFVRLRAAYECALESWRWHAPTGPQDQSDDADDCAAADPDAMPGAAHEKVGWNLHHVVVPDVGTMLVAIKGDASWREQLEARILALSERLADAEGDAADILVEDFMAALPDIEQAYQFAATVLDVLEHRTVSTTILCHGVERGWLELRNSLLLQAPERLDRDALDDIHAHADDVHTRIRVAMAMVERDRERALEIALQELASPKVRQHLKRYVTSFLTAVLRCHQHGAITQAESLLHELEACIESMGLGVELDHYTSSQLKLVQELTALPLDVPGEVRAIIARGIVNRDFDDAVREMDAFARSWPRLGYDAAQTLRAHSLTLARIFSQGLARHWQEQASDTREWTFVERIGFGWVAIIALGTLLRLCAPTSHDDDEHDYPVPPPSEYRWQPPDAPPETNHQPMGEKRPELPFDVDTTNQRLLSEPPPEE